MTFDDRMRDSLEAAAHSQRTGSPPIDELAANVQRRRQRKMALTGGGAALALALLIGLVVALPNSSAPRDRLSAADQPTKSSSDADNGHDAAGTASTTSTSSSTQATGGTIAPAGTAHASPGSVVYPARTTVTTKPAPTTTPPPSGDTVYVTQDDSGKTFSLRPGQHLVVSLSDPGWRWSEPDTDNAAVLQRMAVSANPSSDHVTASFDAKKAGQAHVSATKDAACRDSEPPCMVPSYLWQITVNVV